MSDRPTETDLGDGKPWACSPMACERCGHEWVAVHPRCERVECSRCGFMSQTPPAGTIPPAPINTENADA